MHTLKQLFIHTSTLFTALIGLLMLLATMNNAQANELEDAVEAMRIGDFAEAYCLMKPLAERGNTEAQYNIGWMYHNGYGLRVNDHLALEWWQNASNQGHTDASFSIGMLYDLGEGQVRKNLSKAIDYYLLAANDDHEEAILIIRSMLTRDDSAIRDKKQDLINQYGTLFGPTLQVKANRLNIRKSPSLEGRIVTRLEQGDKVIELLKQGKWSQIGILNSQSENQTIAWAYNPLLEPAVEAKTEASTGSTATETKATDNANVNNSAHKTTLPSPDEHLIPIQHHQQYDYGEDNALSIDEELEDL